MMSIRFYYTRKQGPRQKISTGGGTALFAVKIGSCRAPLKAAQSACKDGAQTI
ncbi:hypothetical protein [Ethanoligenens harbinense]|uniref:hypothetical protein n=1 Tax=Ethanoligenens harbinense TaxID=253239 RepID=UPI0002EC5EF9|nr:hypothetical protein [Ethanoligenens harbinense]